MNKKTKKIFLITILIFLFILLLKFNKILPVSAAVPTLPPTPGATCLGNCPLCTGTIIPSPLPTPIPTPGQCQFCKMYSTAWVDITGTRMKMGNTVFFTTKGAGSVITKARFQINGTANSVWCRGAGFTKTLGLDGKNWCETTNKKPGTTDEYYVSYQFLEGKRFTVQSMVYGTGTGWY